MNYKETTQNKLYFWYIFILLGVKNFYKNSNRTDVDRSVTKFVAIEIY